MSSLAPPSLPEPRRRARSFNGSDSAPVVILPSLPAIHPPGVDEEHPRIPHPFSPPSVSSLSEGDARSVGDALLRVHGAGSTLRSVSPLGRRAHPHPLPSPEHDGLAGFALELVHAAGSNLLHPYMATRAPVAATGSTAAHAAEAGGATSPNPGHVPVPPSPKTEHSLRSLAHQLAGPIMDTQPKNKSSGPLERHRETLVALRDQLSMPQQAVVVPAICAQGPSANSAAGMLPPGLNKRFSAPSMAPTKT